MNNNISTNSTSKINLKFGIIVAMVIIAALSRLLPHAWNVTPIGGMALFGAAYFAKKYWAYIIPFAALWVSDIILNNTIHASSFEGFVLFPSYAVWTFLAFGLMIFLGSKTLKKITAINVIGTSISASLIFFLVTNFGSWAVDPTNLYTNDLSGLITCMSAGLPFFWNTLAGDLLFTGVMFGGFELVKNNYPSLVLNRA